VLSCCSRPSFVRNQRIRIAYAKTNRNENDSHYQVIAHNARPPGPSGGAIGEAWL
jgi:hypothetical protein